LFAAMTEYLTVHGNLINSPNDDHHLDADIKIAEKTLQDIEVEIGNIAKDYPEIVAAEAKRREEEQNTGYVVE
jgi:hypothetical protein